ncbi:unnamed protein product [Heligmosomoides polygyrus]|uniref:Uncharacterized protein n=1 Tax=Heligmosomoides polygyrus TaxID=6339 RepID=A0A183GTM9_HELPZ|nr:unnamed protein product [Heligmosomoides polygyrus]
MNWQNRERVIHEKLFDTLSRPLSKATSTASISRNPFPATSHSPLSPSHRGEV